ncbi:Mucin-2 [Streptomyces tendae]|uniref:Mucin-2 n=1 Tax=Streptomyces tendae TaxID=1932 RepID=UPI00371D2F6A
MMAFHASALDGVARNPALPTALLLRLLAFGADGDRPPRDVLHRAGLPESAVALILAHPNPGVRIDFAMSARAEPAQRARPADDPSPKVRAAPAHGPEVHDPPAKLAPLPDAVRARLLDNPDHAVPAALPKSPHPAPTSLAAMATHHRAAARREAVRAWDALPAGERPALPADPDPEVRRAAELQECQQDARVSAGLLREPKSAAEALHRGLLDRAAAERCAAERTHLASLAENPSLPAGLVERLAADPDEAVRLAVSPRPELDETRRMAIDVTAGDRDTGGGVWRVRDGLAGPEVMRRAAAWAHPLLRRAATRSPRLPPDLLRLLARAEDPMADILLGVHHPDTPQEVLMRVFARPGGTFSAWMAQTHPPVPPRGSGHPLREPPRREPPPAVRDPAATPDLIERLSHDPAIRTRQAAARDPRLPLHRLREALLLPEPASSAGANPALPEDGTATVLDRTGVPARPPGTTGLLAPRSEGCDPPTSS